MRQVESRMMRALVVLVSVGFAVQAIIGAPKLGAASAPMLGRPVFAGIVGAELTLRGTDLGEPPAARSVQFSYEGASITLDASAESIVSWSSSEVQIKLPTEVRSGQVKVVVDGTASPPADLFVFELATYPLPVGTPGALEWPLAIDVDQLGRVWILEEDHTHLKWVRPAVAPTPAMSGKVEIPQAPGAGIFAKSLTGGPVASRFSGAGEDLDVASDGSVWFAQGGGYLYEGTALNTSRIVHYIPGGGGRFQCFVVPTDDAEVLAVLVDDPSGRVWYTESDLDGGNAISSFDPGTIASDCFWDPYTSQRPLLCAEGETNGCHDRFLLPEPYRSPAHLVRGPDGAIWFTEFWASRVGRYDPALRQVTEIPLGTPTVREGPGLFVGSGPWELDFDDSGHLWVSDHFDAAVLRIQPSVVQSQDCTQLDAQGLNPCVEEIYAGSDGHDLRTLHTVTSGSGGRVWFTLADDVGFVSTQHGDSVATMRLPLPVPWVSGIIEDESSGDVWFALFRDHKVGRLREARGDADGLDGLLDNCPDAYNPRQENADRDFVDLSPWSKPFNDLTWPASDETGDACDSDADNDGLTNDVEEAGCATASSPTNPLVRDSDKDLILDGPECSLGSDPMNAASTPMTNPGSDADRDQLSTLVESVLGTNPNTRDTDGDRVYDGVEYRSYGSNPRVRNSDGDACADGYEAASLNGDTAVSSLDLLLVAVSFDISGGPRYVPEFDVNRDGAINSADLAFVAISFGLCKPA